MSMVALCQLTLFAQDPSPFAGIAWWILPIGLILVLHYLMMSRPERRERERATQMRANLKKNDRIVTVGGIIGTVINAPKDSDEISIRIDESSNTRMRILRSAVNRVLGESEEKKEGSLEK